MASRVKRAGVDRRTVLKGMGAAGAVGVLGFPAVLRAQVKEIKIGSIQPMTGPLAAIGKTTRQGNQLAVDHVNAAGGIKSMGGAKLTLVPGDTQYKPEVARAETERLMREGAHVLVGAFDSGTINAMIQAIKQATKPIPLMIDIGAADQLTQQGSKYVFRSFVTTQTLGRKGIEYMLEMFKISGVTPKRAVLLHVTDLFGQVQKDRTLEWHKKLNAPFEFVEIIAYPTTTQDLSTEVAKAKAAKPDLLLAVTRLNDAILLVQEMYKQRVEVQAIMGPGNPGFYHPNFSKTLGKLAEYTLDNVPWYNPKSALTQKVAADYEKRFGEQLTTDSGWAYQGVMVVADILERAGSTDPDKFVEAGRKTNIKDHVTSGGNIQFSENGDNIGASTAMIQIRDGRARVVLPKETAETQLVYPVPKLWERG
ncbi:MAG: ABC transporter substrate-binding protein [candidate division NC10 bacterium]|nr:ABC transporter substrate-binding protein [candidate division NC10 bacterium]MBI2116318.1 ABC transporter substrate-binding protein [candidate division NC10 bacterium]MBI2455884.1 ABC transporter substrate-binding protein [candidate division NC10 bacterium]MBI2917534.1 ABC transporter substrate-binding protein [Chloroflexota bacterium]MBI3085954.1 ABC transporter substrate-binding protein [candidate division NC10 bacterium]